MLGIMAVRRMQGQKAAVGVFFMGGRVPEPPATTTFQMRSLQRVCREAKGRAEEDIEARREHGDKEAQPRFLKCSGCINARYVVGAHGLGLSSRARMQFNSSLVVIVFLEAHCSKGLSRGERASRTYQSARPTIFVACAPTCVLHLICSQL